MYKLFNSNNAIKMKIIYMSRNMENYKGAMYQRDVMNQLSNLCDVIFYGPGFKNFNPNEKFKNTIDKLGGADFIIFGHSWLNDYSGIEVDPYPKIER